MRHRQLGHLLNLDYMDGWLQVTKSLQWWSAACRNEKQEFLFLLSCEFGQHCPQCLNCVIFLGISLKNRIRLEILDVDIPLSTTYHPIKFIMVEETQQVNWHYLQQSLTEGSTLLGNLSVCQVVGVIHNEVHLVRLGDRYVSTSLPQLHLFSIGQDAEVEAQGLDIAILAMFDLYQILIHLTVNKLDIVQGVSFSQKEVQEDTTKLWLDGDVGGQSKTKQTSSDLVLCHRPDYLWIWNELLGDCADEQAHFRMEYFMADRTDKLFGGSTSINSRLLLIKYINKLEFESIPQIFSLKMPHSILVYLFPSDDDVTSIALREVNSNQLPKYGVSRGQIDDEWHILQFLNKYRVVDTCVTPQSLIQTILHKNIRIKQFSPEVLLIDDAQNLG